MNISTTLHSRTFAQVSLPSSLNKPQTSGAVGQGSSGSPTSFARSMDHARTDTAAPSQNGGVFGSGTGGAYGPMNGQTNGPANGPVNGPPIRPVNGPAGANTRVTKPDDNANASSKQGTLPPTGGPDVRADNDPVSDPASGPSTDPVAGPPDRTARAKAEADKLAARTRKAPGAHNAGGSEGNTGSAEAKETAGKGVPGAPSPCFPTEPGAELADPSKEAGPVRQAPIEEEETAGGPLVECPIDSTAALTAMLANTRKADEAAVRAKSAGAADTGDSKQAGGGIGVNPGKNYSTEPVRNVDGDSGGVGDSGADAGKRFGARLQAALGTAADLAQATSAATSAAASTTPSAASAAPGATDGAVLQGKLPASPGSADFGPQLGAQISTFIRDGVHHARLELNPAEMGPLTVQIKLDGLSASVNLAAQHADTRQALEQAMPDLASTLREAGLTLSGGGVSEQPQQAQTSQAGDGDRQAGNGRAEGRTADGDNRTGLDTRHEELGTVVAPPLRPRGFVDLVA